MPLKEYKKKYITKNGEVHYHSYYKEVKGVDAQKRGRKTNVRGDINRMIPNLNDEQLIQVRDFIQNITK